MRELFDKLAARFGGWLTWFYDHLSLGMAVIYEWLLDLIERSIQRFSRKISDLVSGRRERE